MCERKCNTRILQQRERVSGGETGVVIGFHESSRRIGQSQSDRLKATGVMQHAKPWSTCSHARVRGDPDAQHAVSGGARKKESGRCGERKGVIGIRVVLGGSISDQDTFFTQLPMAIVLKQQVE